MNTIVRNVKLPSRDMRDPIREAQVSRVAAHKALTANERNGRQNLKTHGLLQRGPRITTGGERFQTRYAELAKVAKVAGDGLNAIMTIRDSEEAAANPELAALANDPKLMAVIQRVVAKIGKEVAAMIAADKGADYPETGVNNKSSPTGMDAARPILTAEDMERVERACAKLSRLRTAEALGDPGDIVRARLGMDARPATADDLFALGREAEWKHVLRG